MINRALCNLFKMKCATIPDQTIAGFFSPENYALEFDLAQS